jgi:hypothetical protein
VQVRLSAGQGSVIVPLDTERRFGTCGGVGVRALRASPTTIRSDGISDPQVTASNELNVWVTGGASAGYGVNDVEFVD